jgi:hypothetical protein
MPSVQNSTLWQVDNQDQLAQTIEVVVLVGYVVLAVLYVFQCKTNFKFGVLVLLVLVTTPWTLLDAGPVWRPTKYCEVSERLRALVPA